MARSKRKLARILLLAEPRLSGSKNFGLWVASRFDGPSHQLPIIAPVKGHHIRRRRRAMLKVVFHSFVGFAPPADETNRGANDCLPLRFAANGAIDPAILDA